MNFLSVIVTFFAILILVIAIIGLRKVGEKQTIILLLGIISVLFIILGLIFIIPNMEKYWDNYAYNRCGNFGWGVSFNS